MLAPLSWLRNYVDLPGGLPVEELAARLTALGLKLEALEKPGHDLRGPIVVGRVRSKEPEPQKNGKTINWCSVDVGTANGTGEPQGIVCGAHNFEVGDLVVTILPGGVLPGGFEISARKTYGHVSAGMICSTRELGMPQDDHTGILVLPPDAGEPGDDALALLDLRDEVIEFEINPDRAYAMSLRGVAREAALAYDVPFRDPAERTVPVADDRGYPVAIEDPGGCPVFVARTVSGFDPTAPTPDWMQRRLHLVGQRSISLAVDVSNYVMFELGQPIHAYDADQVQGTLGVRRARDGEHLITLDGTDRALSTEDLVVTDESGPIGLGGVMGGASTEISDRTTRVLIESAHWDPASMFRTGKRHRLTSEAGRRNERGVDPAICEAAADRVAELLVRHGGGVIDQGVSVVGSVPARPAISIDPELPARISGLPIPADLAVRHLRAVGCEVTRTDPLIAAVPPPWRPDLSDPYDLVEEVARIVGYDQVPAILPVAPAGHGLTRSQALRRRIGRTLAGSGAVEVLSFPFVGEATFDALGLPADDPRREVVRLANPLSTEQPGYTSTLLPGLLEAAARNLSRGATGVTLFETGLVAVPSGRAAPILGVDRRPTDAELETLYAAVPDQPLHLGVVLAGVIEPPGWWGSGRTATWSDAIQTGRDLAAELGVRLEVEAAELAPWHPGRCAALRIERDGERVTIGHAGELHPKVCTAFGLPRGSAALELDLDPLIAVTPQPTGPPLSAFPQAKEDVALVVDAGLPAEAVARGLREGAGELCESVRLFDVYTGSQVGDGKKSLAFALRFRAPDRTLTDAETGAARDAAVAVAVERFGASQR